MIFVDYSFLRILPVGLACLLLLPVNSWGDCTFTFDVPDHVAGTVQTVTVSASSTCIPASPNVSVGLSCAYQNPITGSLPVIVNDNQVVCDGSYLPVSLSFEANGDTTVYATVTMLYADVGQMQLNASAGLVAGSDGFIAAPASFSIATTGPYIAGQNYNITVTAMNSLGAATPNFGNEAVPEGASLAFALDQPTGSGAVNGSFTGSLGAFTTGTALVNNPYPTWSEVGTLDLTASLTSGSYLGSGFTATGVVNGIGPFVPAYFDVVLTPVCVGYAYSAQPFQVQATANRLGGGTTLNYDGTTDTSPNQAHVVNLSETLASSVGSLANGSIPASAFTNGVGTVTATASSPVSYSFASQTAGPPTPPTTISLRAVDSVNSSVISLGHETAASTEVRRGRLTLSNVFGAETSALSMPVIAQYWDGLSWVINSTDHCTVIPTSALNRIYSGTGGTPTPTGATLVGGQGNIVFNPPSPAGTGSVDVAVNLGASGADQSCLSSHGGTASSQPWLRSQNGSCAKTYDRDPSARASFGIYAPETSKLMHVRELY